MSKRKCARINIQGDPDSEMDVTVETMFTTSGKAMTTRCLHSKKRAHVPVTPPAPHTSSLSESVFATANENKKRKQVHTFVPLHVK